MYAILLQKPIICFNRVEITSCDARGDAVCVFVVVVGGGNLDKSIEEASLINSELFQ